MKTRKFRFVTAMILSLVMIFAMAPTVMAESDGSITVNVTIKNDTFTQPLVNLNGVTKTPAWTGILFGKTVKIKVDENEILGDAIADHLGGFAVYDTTYGGYFDSFDGQKGMINVEEYLDPAYGPPAYDMSGFKFIVNGASPEISPSWGAGVCDFINTTEAIPGKLRINDDDNVLFAYTVDGADIDTPYISSPQNVKAKAAGTKTIKISWTKNPKATVYEVYRAAKKNGTYKKVATTKTNSYKNTGLTSGKAYYYKVKMVRNQNVSSLSKYSATAPRPGKASIKSIKKGSKTLKISWKKVPGAKSYQVYRAASKNGKYKKIKTLSAGKLSYTNKKLKSGKKYYYKVRALTKVDGRNIYGTFSLKKSGQAK